MIFCFFFFNDTATTEIYTLSLHDALPICQAAFGGRVQDVNRAAETRRSRCSAVAPLDPAPCGMRARRGAAQFQDRKSTRLNSSHLVISYAVFCLKKKKNQPYHHLRRPPTP